jgi:hypothetical protein
MVVYFGNEKKMKMKEGTSLHEDALEECNTKKSNDITRRWQ